MTEWRGALKFACISLLGLAGLSACSSAGGSPASQVAPPDKLSELTGAETLDNGCFVTNDQAVCPIVTQLKAEGRNQQ